MADETRRYAAEIGRPADDDVIGKGEDDDAFEEDDDFEDDEDIEDGDDDEE